MSPSASDAVTPTLLVCASVIVPGDAVGTELMDDVGGPGMRDGRCDIHLPALD